MSTSANSQFHASPDTLQKSAMLLIAMIVIAVIGVFVLLGDMVMVDANKQKNHAIQFALIAVFGLLVLMAVVAQWIFNRADDDVWDREISMAGDFTDYRAAVRRCRRRLVCDSIDQPVPNDPWSAESLQRWDRCKWLFVVGVITAIIVGLGVGCAAAKLGYSGPLVSGVCQLFITMPMLFLITWRSMQVPPRIDEDLFGTEPTIDNPWYHYHDSVLMELGLWFLVSGQAYGRESRGVYLNDTGNLVVELGEESCRITTLLSDDTAVQTGFSGESEIYQFVNAKRSTQATSEPATRLLEAFNQHQDAVDTAIKYAEAIPVRLTAENYAKALAYARWREAV